MATFSAIGLPTRISSVSLASRRGGRSEPGSGAILFERSGDYFKRRPAAGSPPHAAADGPMQASAKQDLPVSQVRRFLEPGPIVLLSSAWKGKTNIMTMGWHTVMEFAP